MLDSAKRYEEKLKQLFFDIEYDPYYFYSYYAAYREVFKIPDDTWQGNHFVSVHNGEIIGYIKYGIKRSEYSVDALYVVHFGGKTAPNGYIFCKDVITAIRDVFEKYGFNKVNFSVVIGNPIEKTYDKMITRYGGRIVGIRKSDLRLIDGKLYDSKEYEILSSEYFGRLKKE